MSGDASFTETTVEDYAPMVHQISKEYHRKYGMVEREDIVQELWMWFATHTRKLGEWNNEFPDMKERDRLVAKSLRNSAYDYCFKEKARIEGYSTEDVFFYKKEFIKMLLPSIIAGDWSRMENVLSLGGKSSKAPAEANDWMAYSADIQKALDKLESKDKVLVEQFYGNDIDGETLHQELLPEKSTARAAMMQANRALNKMVRELGGFPPAKDKEKDEGEQDG
jgi:DNA-directed RNA polymerase specialized sigma24 family protein